VDVGGAMGGWSFHMLDAMVRSLCAETKLKQPCFAARPPLFFSCCSSIFVKRAHDGVGVNPGPGRRCYVLGGRERHAARLRRRAPKPRRLQSQRELRNRVSAHARSLHIYRKPRRALVNVLFLRTHMQAEFLQSRIVSDWRVRVSI
jgi:hypothetical protein